jgi:hypothetical protein
MDKDEALKEADVLIMAEAHGIDPSTKGLYGFYIDCISNQPTAQEPSGFFRHEDVCGDEVAPPTPYYLTPPAAQPAVPDAIGPNEDELPAYAAGWNDCRQAMMEMMK